MFPLIKLLSIWKSNPTDKASLAIKILNETERLLENKELKRLSRDSWLEFLDLTKKPVFLLALGTDESRTRWAELVFRIIQHTNYTLRDMFMQRVAEHPQRIFFKDMLPVNPVDWTYEQIWSHVREIASVFYSVQKTPRVAIFSDNCVEGACCDLACLCYEIFDTPLSIHFNLETLVVIFDRLKINIAVADSRSRLDLLEQTRQKTRNPFIIYSIIPGIQKNKSVHFLPEECKKTGRKEIGDLLSGHVSGSGQAVATTMFTSGSTGLPKGVSFSIYNIVSKRFARAAAIPTAGDETFLCYLPLFHTFGRYLELTGSLFWNGTYVFAGNTSAETLLSQFPRINPTGFISIPLRWQELYDKCQEKIMAIDNRELRVRAVREVVGRNLRWGLSAAGYLDPKVFRFFNDYGIRFCSGFGMTEATGGITMTPPGKYRDSTVGIPLPGVRTRLSGQSELEISGHYIARYLEEAGPGDRIPYPVSPEKDQWLSTGDVFTVTKEGYYEIVDRLKDIYKNNRGQTIAPQVVEKKFLKVPGIRSTFLVGDNRPYNVLLIVPDYKDPLVTSLKGPNLQEYFHQIVTAANADVAPYERVINFTVLNRDFSTDKGEITPKGSFNRKIIGQNFREVIGQSYRSNNILIKAGQVSISVPKWFFRDLGILETDIVYQEHQLVNKRTHQTLFVKRSSDGFIRIGDLKYSDGAAIIDLGYYTRQPALWIANPALISFCPVKEGWDVQTASVPERIFVTAFKKSEPGEWALKTIRDPYLVNVNQLLCRAFFSDPEESFKALDELSKIFGDAEPRMAEVILNRLEALAYHPEEEIRTMSYRMILLHAPRPEKIEHLPAFIESGLSFLNEKSIHEIAASNLGKHRLDALKQRLYYYRTHMKWPASARTRKQFEDVLRMLFNFAIRHLDFYVPVRAELSRWTLHKQDPYLSSKAEDFFNRLSVVFEKEMKKRSGRYPIATWKNKVMFEPGITEEEKKRILKIFQSTKFLEESIILTFNEWDFDLDDVPATGIWVLRLLAQKEFRHYRLSINTTSEKHFDLHMVMSENPKFRPGPSTFYWLASLAGFPYGPAVGPMLGSSRPELGILTTQYIGGLTAWDKIREYAEIHRMKGFLRPNSWRKVFVRSFAVVFKAWHHSGYQIVPGTITPSNIVIPELDFRESAVILSLTGWTSYKNTLSLIEPMVLDFYCRTTALYPWCSKQLEIKWIFDGCIEALGKEEAAQFLETLRKELIKKKIGCFDHTDLTRALDNYIRSDLKKFYLPLSLFHAIDRYEEWFRMNPSTTSDAREQTLSELMELYRLQNFPEIVRYYFYRHSYFFNAAAEILTAFDRLLEKMLTSPELLPLQLVELSDLQSAIELQEDKNVFSRMVFPRLQGEQIIDFLRVGEHLKEHLVVRFTLQDKTGNKYVQREPIEPREIGQLYQLFFKENYPKDITNSDHHQVVVDKNERLIGGLIWRTLDNDTVLLEGIVVTSALQGKGIASAMIGNFFSGMASIGIKTVKAHFLFGNYYMKHFFEVDKKWGALIRTLNAGTGRDLSQQNDKSINQ